MSNTVTTEFLLKYQDSLVEAELFKQEVIKKMQQAQGGSAEAWKEFADAAAQEFKRVQESSKLTLEKVQAGMQLVTTEAKSLAQSFAANAEVASKFGEEIDHTSQKLGVIAQGYRTAGIAGAFFAGLVEGTKEAMAGMTTGAARITEIYGTQIKVLGAGAEVIVGARRDHEKYTMALHESSRALAEMTGQKAGLTELRSEFEKAFSAAGQAQQAFARGTLSEQEQKDATQRAAEAWRDYTAAVKEATQANRDAQKAIEDTKRSETSSNKASDDPMIAKAREAKKAAEEAKQYYGEVTAAALHHIDLEDQAEEARAAKRRALRDYQRLLDQQDVDDLKKEQAERARILKDAHDYQMELLREGEAEQALARQREKDQLEEFGETMKRFESAAAPVGDVLGAVFKKVGDNIAQEHKLLSGLGAAFKEGFHGVFETLGKKYFGEGLGLEADFLAALVTPGMQPFAGGFQAAALAKFGAAALFGIGGALTATKGSGSTSSAGRGDFGSGGAGGATGLARPGDSSGPQRMPTVEVYLGGREGSITVHADSSRRGQAFAGEILEQLRGAYLESGPRLN